MSNDVSTNVLIIGSLGELVKKLIEMEIRTKSSPEDRPLLADVAAYSKLFEEWPVLDKGTVDNLIYVMRIEVNKIFYLEKELEALSELISKPVQASTTKENQLFILNTTVKSWLNTRNSVRNIMSLLNQQGRAFSNPPQMPMHYETEKLQAEFAFGEL